MLRDVLQRIPQARLAFVGDGPEREALEKHFAGTRTVFTVRSNRLAGTSWSSPHASLHHANMQPNGPCSCNCRLQLRSASSSRLKRTAVIPHVRRARWEV